MRSVSAREANQAFSRILGEAEAGEEIVITRRGKPVATLRPYQKPKYDTRKAGRIERALERLEKGLPLGMTRPFTRDEMHER